VLDLGCGPGADLAHFGERATSAEPAGLAVGLDRSLRMTATAAEHGPTLVADATEVPLRAASFDAVWIRAVLLHVPDPQQAVAEAWRVLRPGGRIAVMEPDHGSHLVGPGDTDVFERIRAHRYLGFQHPRIGRQVPDLLVAAGFVDVEAHMVTTSVTDLAVARAGGGPFDRAVDDAVDAAAITAEEGRAYLAALEAADQRGAFLFSAASVVATARRPT
jgi:SAM-dependent methyltransferase